METTSWGYIRKKIEPLGVGAAGALQARDQRTQKDFVETQLTGRGDLFHER